MKPKYRPYGSKGKLAVYDETIRRLPSICLIWAVSLRNQCLLEIKTFWIECKQLICHNLIFQKIWTTQSDSWQYSSSIKPTAERDHSSLMHRCNGYIKHHHSNLFVFCLIKMSHQLRFRLWLTIQFSQRRSNLQATCFQIANHRIDLISNDATFFVSDKYSPRYLCQQWLR